MIDDFKKEPPRPDKRLVSWVAGAWVLVFAGAIVFGIAQKASDRSEDAAAARDERRAIEQANGFKVADLLFVGATNLAEERGLIYTRLREGSSATPELRARLAERRAASDRALDQAIGLIASSVAIPRRDKAIKAIGEQRARFDTLRGEVDAWRQNEKDKSAVRLSSNWFASSSRLIAATEDLLILVHYKLRGKDPTVDISLKLQHLAWIMSEFAARERGLLSGAIAENRLSHQDAAWTRASVFRRFDIAWHSARSISTLPEMPREVRATMDEIEQAFIRDLMTIRDDIIQLNESQSPNSGAPSIWFERATDAIKPMVKLGRLAGEVARNRSVAPRAELMGAIA